LDYSSTNQTVNASFFSKSLSEVCINTSWFGYVPMFSTNAYLHLLGVGNCLSHSTLRQKHNLKITQPSIRQITLNEAFYTLPNIKNSRKVRNIQVRLSELHGIQKTKNYPSLFNFNLATNLELAKQSMWLSKNSLLSESIMPNSFLITQSKKLLGSGFLDKNISDKTL
jgi:hypothetical protein